METSISGNFYILETSVFWKLLYSGNFYILETCIFRKLVYSGNLYIQETCIFRKLVYSGNLYIQETCIFWKLVYSGNWYILETGIFWKSIFFFKSCTQKTSYKTIYVKKMSYCVDLKELFDLKNSLKPKTRIFCKFYFL